MLSLQPGNTIIDIPDLNRFRIGDRVVVDPTGDYDRFEGVIIGIELQRVYASNYLVPSITLLHDGCITDGFKPIDCRKVDPTPPETLPVVFLKSCESLNGGHAGYKICGPNDKGAFPVYPARQHWAMDIPPGWKLVPEQATPEMEEAAVANVRPYHDIGAKAWRSLVPGDLFRIAWPAMLAAAPDAVDKQDVDNGDSGD